MKLQTAAHTIACNAGVEGAVVVGKLLEQDNTDLGYDAAKGRSNLFKLGILLLKGCLSNCCFSFMYNLRRIC
jgi:hypothetical protein